MRRMGEESSGRGGRLGKEGMSSFKGMHAISFGPSRDKDNSEASEVEGMNQQQGGPGQGAGNMQQPGLAMQMQANVQTSQMMQPGMNVSGNVGLQQSGMSMSNFPAQSGFERLGSLVGNMQDGFTRTGSSFNTGFDRLGSSSGTFDRVPSAVNPNNFERLTSAVNQNQPIDRLTSIPQNTFERVVSTSHQGQFERIGSAFPNSQGGQFFNHGFDRLGSISGFDRLGSISIPNQNSVDNINVNSLNDPNQMAKGNIFPLQNNMGGQGQFTRTPSIGIPGQFPTWLSNSGPGVNSNVSSIKQPGMGGNPNTPGPMSNPSGPEWGALQRTMSSGNNTFGRTASSGFIMPGDFGPDKSLQPVEMFRVRREHFDADWQWDTGMGNDGMWMGGGIQNFQSHMPPGMQQPSMHHFPQQGMQDPQMQQMQGMQNPGNLQVPFPNQSMPSNGLYNNMGDKMGMPNDDFDDRKGKKGGSAGPAFLKLLEDLEKDGVIERHLDARVPENLGGEMRVSLVDMLKLVEGVCGWTVKEGMMDEWQRRRQVETMNAMWVRPEILYQAWFMEGKEGKEYKPNSLYQIMRRLGYFPTMRSRYGEQSLLTGDIDRAAAELAMDMTSRGAACSDGIRSGEDEQGMAGAYVYCRIGDTLRDGRKQARGRDGGWSRETRGNSSDSADEHVKFDLEHDKVTWTAAGGEREGNLVVGGLDDVVGLLEEVAIPDKRHKTEREVHVQNSHTEFELVQEDVDCLLHEEILRGKMSCCGVFLLLAPQPPLHLSSGRPDAPPRPRQRDGRRRCGRRGQASRTAATCTCGER
eukprot:761266-Hanusia_phi.AAC.1